MSVLKGEIMTDPIKDYARAVAEAVLMVCEESGLPDMDAEDVRESLDNPNLSYDDLRAEIERLKGERP